MKETWEEKGEMECGGKRMKIRRNEDEGSEGS